MIDEKDRKKKVLLTNTALLYLLTFSTYILNFIIVPYQTRILEPEKYGLIGVATAIMVYFQLIIDFGFLLSATAEVSENRHDKNKLSKILSSVTIIKIGLSLISFVILITLCFAIEQWKDNVLLFSLYFCATFINSLIPDYLYRGIEQMGAITVRTVLIKLFFTLSVFIFVKKSSDYMLIPIIQIVGNIIALFAVYTHLIFKLKIKFVYCSIAEVIGRLKCSAAFFLSRIATTIYTTANTIIIDLVSGGGATAYYSSADKLISTARSGFSPISDSLYPYMIKNRDFKLVKKILLIIEPIVIFACVLVFVWSKELCIWFFGEEYLQSAYALRALLPTVVISLPTYVLGFPMLGAMGLNKHGNYSIIFGSCFHILGLICLLATNSINIVTLGIMTSITEMLILGYRICVIALNVKKVKHDGVGN